MSVKLIFCFLQNKFDKQYNVMCLAVLSKECRLNKKLQLECMAFLPCTHGKCGFPLLSWVLGGLETDPLLWGGSLRYMRPSNRPGTKQATVVKMTKDWFCFV